MPPGLGFVVVGPDGSGKTVEEAEEIPLIFNGDFVSRPAL